jgi:hypothetical protein
LANRVHCKPCLGPVCLGVLRNTQCVPCAVRRGVLCVTSTELQEFTA